MVRSTASDVEGHIAEAPEERREVLRALRDVCRQALPGFDERMEHGMPSYARDGGLELAFAGQRQHISVYVLRPDVLAAHEDRLAHLDRGKGCVRFRRPQLVALELGGSLASGVAGRPDQVG